jgi:lipopolysaccharide export system protein LptA
VKNGVRRYDWTIAAATLLMVLAFGASQVAAQADKKSDKKSGFSVDRTGPIKIQSTTLEVRDKEKKATFKGSVHVVQGETEIRCNILVVFYDTEAKKAAPAPTADGRRGSEQIRYMEAQGNVIVTQKDQTATGDRADFDMRSNTVTLKGNVVVTRGHDVLRGQRLVVDLTTGVTKMESGGGRVEGLFRSSKQDKGKAAGPEPKKDDRNDPKRRGAGGPTGLY